MTTWRYLFIDEDGDLTGSNSDEMVERAEADGDCSFSIHRNNIHAIDKQEDLWLNEESDDE